MTQFLEPDVFLLKNELPRTREIDVLYDTLKQEQNLFDPELFSPTDDEPEEPGGRGLFAFLRGFGGFRRCRNVAPKRPRRRRPRRGL